MTNENEILRMIRERVGLSMTCSSDFDVLSQSIRDVTDENLGVNTLKRFFGFKTDKVAARQSTLDIMARYLGYEDFETLTKAIGEEADISMFAPVDCIEVQGLLASHGSFRRIISARVIPSISSPILFSVFKELRHSTENSCNDNKISRIS